MLLPVASKIPGWVPVAFVPFTPTHTHTRDGPLPGAGPSWRGGCWGGCWGGGGLGFRAHISGKVGDMLGEIAFRWQAADDPRAHNTCAGWVSQFHQLVRVFSTRLFCHE